MSGEKTFDRILIRPASYWDEKQVTLLLGQEVTGVDAAEKTVALADGRTMSYGHLIWATGGDPRRLDCPGAHFSGVHGVRDRADADAIMAELSGVERVVVVGGGYIGLEAAAILTKLGKHVTVLEAMPRVLARVAGEALSRFYEAEHRGHGVDLRTDAKVRCLTGEDGRVTGVELDDGELVPADMVIVGIGIVPAVGPLLDAGARGGNGVLVDGHCRTSLPNVFAIGDCAAHENRFAEGAIIRLESVQNANDQATLVARVILGQDVPAYGATPWFWSNQYDLRLQTVGLSAGHDEAVLRGVPASRSFSVAYLRGGRLIALDCVNNAKDYVQGRKLVEAGIHADPARLADAATPLKELLPA